MGLCVLTNDKRGVIINIVVTEYLATHDIAFGGRAQHFVELGTRLSYAEVAQR
jgi:hypothetical protein